MDLPRCETNSWEEICDLAYCTFWRARHGFELYFVCQNVEGLISGTYHYLPMEHRIEFLNPIEKISDVLASSLCDQLWALKANVIFYFSYIPYRTEWRYGYLAHRIALVDLGHVGENIYLASTSIGLGTCGIGALSLIHI